MISKKTIFQVFLFLIFIFFAYLIYKLTIPSVTAVKQDFTSVSSAIVSDSINVWVANMLQNTVDKFDTNGKFITSFPAGPGTQQLILVGQFVWATNYYDNCVLKIDSDSGQSAKIQVGSAPVGMAFDGTNVWVSNYQSGTCSVVSQSSGSVVATLNVGQGPTGVLFDGLNVWVCCLASSEVYVFDVTKLTLVNNFSVGKNPFRMTCMNDIVYVLDASEQSSIYQVDTNGIVNVYKPGIGLSNDITNDGQTLFTASELGNVYNFDPNKNVLKNGFSSGVQTQFIQIVKKNIFLLNQKENSGTIFDKSGNALNNINF
jgi:YVTN family beta-propeller protein